ncbi:hypothetical protein [Embleya sp. NPDC059237]|uniref:hypothetical protein n=1 Tax=Embleya sp. NPDC059237 TaxID=3346784 RepID=UPI0036ACCD76
MSNPVLAWITTLGIVATTAILGLKTLLPHVRDLLDEVAKTTDKWHEVRGRSSDRPAKQWPEVGQDNGRGLKGISSPHDVPTGPVSRGVPNPFDRDDAPAFKVAGPPDVDSATGRCNLDVRGPGSLDQTPGPQRELTGHVDAPINVEAETPSPERTNPSP